MARPKHRERQAGTYFVTAGTWQRRSLFHKHDWAAVVEEKIVHYLNRVLLALHLGPYCGLQNTVTVSHSARPAPAGLPLKRAAQTAVLQG
jgi:hypothetical protein